MESLMQAVPYALGVLVTVGAALMLYKYDRVQFDAIARGVFLSIEKDLGSEDGQEKMSQAVLQIVELLPAQLKAALTFVATLLGTDLHGLAHKLAQETYDLIARK